MNRDENTTHPALGVLNLFMEYGKHTLLTVGIYIILVLSTLLLDYCAHLLEKSSFHYNVLIFIERAIFLTASLLLLLVMLYISIVFVRDLLVSFKRVFADTET